MENKIKCDYPGCKKERKFRHLLDLINEKAASVDLPFCDYHYYIVMGGHFKAKIIVEDEKVDSFELIGPFHEVEITEQVIAAREMVAKLKSDD